MFKRFFAAGMILVLLLMQGCAKKEEICETDFYRDDVILPMINDVGVNGQLPPMSDGICVIESEDIFDPELLSIPVAALFCEDAKEVLYAKNALDKIYPASMTKCMTALLVLEHFQDLNTTVTAGEDLMDNIPENSSLAGLTPGDICTVRDLLTGLLVPSGNEAANVLAKAVSGSVPAFVELMNSRADELGMINTHFANPNGIHLESHYTTAYDLYLLMRECMKYSDFREIAGMDNASVTVRRDDGSERTLSFTSTNSFARGFTVPPEGISYRYSKTGYTQEAGRCLLAVFEDAEGKSYISVSAGAEKYDDLYLQTNAMLTIIGQE